MQEKPKFFRLKFKDKTMNKKQWYEKIETDEMLTCLIEQEMRIKEDV